jgi:hypothetical protein
VASRLPRQRRKGSPYLPETWLSWGLDVQAPRATAREAWVAVLRCARARVLAGRCWFDGQKLQKFELKPRISINKSCRLKHCLQLLQRATGHLMNVLAENVR